MARTRKTSAKPRRHGKAHGGANRRSRSGIAGRRSHADGVWRILNPIIDKVRGKSSRKESNPPRRRRRRRTGRRGIRIWPRGRVVRRRRWWFRPRPLPVVVASRPLLVDPQLQWATTCPSPLSSDCQRLQITPSWGVSCFMPKYYEMIGLYGPDFEGIVNDILIQQTPQCHLVPVSYAEHELRRRVALAVAVLMNQEGYVVPIPSDPSLTPRPPGADMIRQPWLRALVTGWL